MLDVMPGGRILPGFVRGVPQEFLALSVPLPDARQRMAEAWDLIIKAWTTREPFEWHGKYFQYDRVCIAPRPHRQPHPPIVLPADSDEGLDVLACPRCGGRLRLMATVDEPDAIRAVLAAIAASRELAERAPPVLRRPTPATPAPYEDVKLKGVTR
jgi:alkanesulfonate monooxygenase SsuD/methylene tetrahydromethanopterin reductase-like flavin-dependent oxidoreductase (luciferase family)